MQLKFDKFHFPPPILVSESIFHPSCIVLTIYKYDHKTSIFACLEITPRLPRKNIDFNVKL